MPGERLETVRLGSLSPVQSRLTTDLATAERYAELYREGADLGPGRAVREVRQERGKEAVSYWLWDGIHRKQARGLADLEDMAVLVTDGTERDARRLSLGANATHGLQRSDDDKRHAVNICLNDAEWSKWSDREIAGACGVSRALVMKCRRLHLTGRAAGEDRRTYQTRHGTEATMDVSGIGASNRRRAAERDDGPEVELRPGPERDACQPEARQQPRRVVHDEALILDGKGDAVPEALADFFGDPSPGELADAVEAIRLDPLIHNLEGKSRSFPYLKVSTLQKCWQAIEAELAEMAATIANGRPYAACPACGGSRCGECRGCGHVPQWRYDELMEQQGLTGDGAVEEGAA